MSAVCVGWILPGMHLAHFFLVHARRGASSDGLVLFHVCQTQLPLSPFNDPVYRRSVVAGAFSSIIAYGLSTIKADHLSGWRWILVSHTYASISDSAYSVCGTTDH